MTQPIINRVILIILAVTSFSQLWGYTDSHSVGTFDATIGGNEASESVNLKMPNVEKAFYLDFQPGFTFGSLIDASNPDMISADLSVGFSYKNQNVEIDLELMHFHFNTISNPLLNRIDNFAYHLNLFNFKLRYHLFAHWNLLVDGGILRSNQDILVSTGFFIVSPGLEYVVSNNINKNESAGSQLALALYPFMIIPLTSYRATNQQSSEFLRSQWNMTGIVSLKVPVTNSFNINGKSSLHFNVTNEHSFYWISSIEAYFDLNHTYNIALIVELSVPIIPFIDHTNVFVQYFNRQSQLSLYLRLGLDVKE